MNLSRIIRSLFYSQTYIQWICVRFGPVFLSKKRIIFVFLTASLHFYEKFDYLYLRYFPHNNCAISTSTNQKLTARTVLAGDYAGSMSIANANRNTKLIVPQLKDNYIIMEEYQQKFTARLLGLFGRCQLMQMFHR